MAAVIALTTSTLSSPSSDDAAALARELIGGDPERAADLLVAAVHLTLVLLTRADPADPIGELQTVARIVAGS